MINEINIVNQLNNIIEKYSKNDIPVIENDSNYGALYFNSHKNDNSNNILYFHISIPYYVTDPAGVGIGIIIKNKLHHGSNNCTGEVEIKKINVQLQRKYNFWKINK